MYAIYSHTHTRTYDGQVDGGGLGWAVLVVHTAAVRVLVAGTHGAHAQARRGQLQVKLCPLPEHRLVAPVPTTRLSQVVAGEGKKRDGSSYLIVLILYFPFSVSFSLSVFVCLAVYSLSFFLSQFGKQ